MNRFGIKPNPNAGAHEQSGTVHYGDSAPLAVLTTQEGSISLKPNGERPWFRVEDGGNGCLFGKWQNLSGVDSQKITKTGTIIAVETVDGKTISTLDSIRDPKADDGAPTIPTQDFGKFFAAALRATILGDPDPAAAAVREVLEDGGSTRPRQSPTSVKPPSKHLH